MWKERERDVTCSFLALKPGALGLITSLQNALPPSGLGGNGWSLINQVQPNLVGESSASLSDPFVPCTSKIGDYALFSPRLSSF